MLPWEEAYLRGQLVNRLDDLSSGASQRTKNRRKLQQKLGLDTDRPLRNYALLSRDLFEPYPVLLLQWKDRPAELPISWNSLYENRKKIVEFIKEHPDLEEFYKGKSCSTKNNYSHRYSFAQVTQQKSILIRPRLRRSKLRGGVQSTVWRAFLFTN